MAEKQIQNELIGKIAIAKLIKAGYNDQEIGVILISSLCHELWKRMTPEQKSQYNNDLDSFCEKEIRKAEKRRAEEMQNLMSKPKN